YFPGVVRRLVRAGEEGNVLPTMLRSLSRYLQSAREIQHKLQKCLIYPFFVWTILLIDAIVLLVFVIPGFSDTYRTLGADLPVFTQFFIRGGSTLLILGNGLLFFLAWLLIGFLGTDVEGTSRMSGAMDRILARIPLLSTLHRHAKAAQICDVLGALIEGGRSGREAVTIAKTAVTSPTLERALEDVDTAIASGQEYEPTETETLLPQTTLWMLAQADGAPDLGKTLQNLSEHHRRQLDVQSAVIREILEPLLLIAVALVGGFAIISVYWPIFSVANAIM
ncbi:MAG: type II secretion system F family protein, partial [bacterium]